MLLKFVIVEDMFMALLLKNHNTFGYSSQEEPANSTVELNVLFSKRLQLLHTK